MPRPVFSISDLLTFLDVDDVPLVSTPFPANLSGLSRELSFTMSPRLLPPRGANLSVTPVLCRLHIDDFRAAGSATWQHVHDYVVAYLSDTLTKVPRAEGLPSYRTYQGHGVAVGFTYTPPSAPNGALSIDLVVVRDEPPAQTIARAFGVELPVASALDRNWRDVATTREMHVEAAAVGDEVWMRTSAQYIAAQSDASRCAGWVRSWLRLWESYVEGAMSVRSVEDRTLAQAERATRHPVRSASVVTIELGGERRRDQFEVHMPRIWLDDAAQERHQPSIGTSVR